MKKAAKKMKVFVAMSGGVDSSVAAALLKKSGHNVVGVFIRGFYPSGLGCTWREDRRDAMRVCAVLDIPFYAFDFSKEYKKEVFDYMISEYKFGRTPNPDVACNKHIKFSLFLKKARKMGADKIATGHYVKISKFKSQISKLLIARDRQKDQSYFLWTLTQKQLKYCLFPIGNYLKSDVRALARKFRLPVSEKPDSQGVCFIGEFKTEDFLKGYIKSKPGEIINEKGEIIGCHKGMHFYTVGQRQGIGVSAKEPYYVVKKDRQKNILYVAQKTSEENFYKKEILIKSINWVSGIQPVFSKRYSARIRYRQPLQKCKLKSFGSKIKPEFDVPQRAAAPGQSAVIYDKNIMLGGGIIV